MEKTVFQISKTFESLIIHLNNSIFIEEKDNLSDAFLNSTSNKILTILYPNDAQLCNDLSLDFTQSFLSNVDINTQLSDQEIQIWVEHRLNSQIVMDQKQTETYINLGIDIETEDLDIRESSFSVQDIALKIDEKSFITDPEFQRNFVWSKSQQNRFIESIILNIPLPPIYLNATRNGKYMIVDGLQRSTTIYNFLSPSTNGEGFVLSGLEILSTLNGLQYKDLSTSIKTRLRDKRINIYIIRPNIPMPLVYEIFNRINTAGSPLNAQEVRNCIYIGTSTLLLKYLSKLENFWKAIDYGVSSKRMKDRELIIRFIAFYIQDLNEYKGSIDEFLAKAMQDLNKDGEQIFNSYDINDLTTLALDENFLNNRIEELKKIKKFKRIIDGFVSSMELGIELFGKNGFRLPTSTTRGRINIALFETISCFLAQYEYQSIIDNKAKILKNYQTLLQNNTFIDSITSSTASIQNVNKRFTLSKNILCEGIELVKINNY